MVEGKVSGEQGGEDKVLPKAEGGEGEASAAEAAEAAKLTEEQANAEGDKGEGEKSKEDQEAEFRAELVKRFGEKSDKELFQEVWKAYRNGETTFSQSQGKVKELEDLVNQSGGIEAMKAALDKKAAPADGSAGEYPAKIQSLIDSGDLNPEDPRDALIIEQEMRLSQNQSTLGKTAYKEALKTFDGWLDDAAKNYEHADFKIIRELGVKGAFANMNDEQVVAEIDKIAKLQHDRVMGLVDEKTKKKLDELKKLSDGKLNDADPGGGKLDSLSPEQAFTREYQKHFN